MTISAVPFCELNGKEQMDDQIDYLLDRVT